MANNTDGCHLSHDGGLANTNSKLIRINAGNPITQSFPSRRLRAYFATFLRDTAELALDELMDFLADEEAESFEIVWNQEVFEEGKVGLEESTFYPYPRY